MRQTKRRRKETDKEMHPETDRETNGVTDKETDIHILTKSKETDKE